MATSTVEGKVIQISEPKEGEGKKGHYHSQEFVIETFGNYPQYYPIKAFNKQSETSNIQIGSLVKVEYKDGGRKWENTAKGITQYFAEYNANKIEMLGAMSATPQTVPQVQPTVQATEEPVKTINEEDVPF